MKYLLITTMLLLFSCGKSLDINSGTMNIESKMEYLVFETLEDTLDIPLDASIGQYLSDRLEVKEDGKLGLKDSMSILPGLYYYKLSTGEVNFIFVSESILEAPTGTLSISLPRGVSKWVKIEGIELYKEDVNYADRIKGQSFLIRGDDEGSLNLISGVSNLSLSVAREDIQVVIGDQLRPPEVIINFNSYYGGVSFYRDGELIGQLNHVNPSTKQSVVMAAYSSETGVFTDYSTGGATTEGSFAQVVSEADEGTLLFYEWSVPTGLLAVEIPLTTFSVGKLAPSISEFSEFPYSVSSYAYLYQSYKYTWIGTKGEYETMSEAGAPFVTPFQSNLDGTINFIPE